MNALLRDEPIATYKTIAIEFAKRREKDYYRHIDEEDLYAPQ
jgi:hypothetical protein